MRLHSLLALAAAGALLMPLAANAGKCPEGKKSSYMTQCVDTAESKGLDFKTANKHCECGAKALETNFTDAEIQALDTKNGVDAQLMQRAQAAVQKACAPK
jgi:hypothetical protein